MKNTGKDYERLVLTVYQAILKLHGLTNIEVKPSQKIPGNTISHEIDVHWEFEIGGKSFKTVIQAKDIIAAVKPGQMINFEGVVKDIPGADGIFVAKSGFQKGAITWAKAKGIEAAELRPPTDDEKDGRVEQIKMDFNVEFLKVTALEDVVVEPSWARTLSQEDADQIKPVPVQIDSIAVEDEAGNVLDDLHHYATDDSHFAEGEDQATYIKKCEPPVFLVGVFSQKIKVSQFKVTLERERVVESFDIKAVLTHILRSVTGNNSYLIAEIDGELHAFLPEDMKKQD